ncbi:MAG: type II toxin-antitoxin system RelE/ParE family toxin [Planctomycetaceae bacterium]|nr:type II toxin-antitoxin system RelE/ParE family toxin [Planctomycetaceae bacterium]
MSTVVFHRLAAREYRFARDWYRQRSTEVAERFKEAVDRATDRIATRGDCLPVFARGYRYVRVNRFPYVLVFRREDDREITVVAVTHTSRRPGYWRTRD